MSQSYAFFGRFVHSAIDVVLLFYSIYWQQFIIAVLFLVIICLNIWNTANEFLKGFFKILREFDVKLCHSSLQMLPLSLSISFYNTNDKFINITFIFIIISFINTLYSESNKMSSDGDNNTKILKIMCLCVILDYIQLITLILTKIHVINNYYFYKFIISTYSFIFPFIIGAIYDVIYRFGARKLLKDFVNKIKNITIYDITIKNIAICLGICCWSILLITIFFPVLMESVNASWIIFFYERFFRKLRHSKHFDEQLKDKLVKWLQRDKDDLLIKICCINHIKLISSNDPLLKYLKDNIKSNKCYYKKVTWYGIKQNSIKFANKHLLNTLKNDLVNFIKWDFQCNQIKLRWNAFIQHPTSITLYKCLGALSWVFFMIHLIFYVICTLLNIFIWPFITLWIIHDSMDIHQSCFIALYFLLLFVILYKSYYLVQYEKIMWYLIPDLDNLNCTKKDIDGFIQYYKYIKHDCIEMEYILTHMFGNDIATVILHYVPDYIYLFQYEPLALFNI